MRTAIVAVLLVYLGGWQASAAGYDDFAHGMSANAQGQSDAAVGFFSSAIAAGDLNPALLSTAYRGRALALLRLEKCGEALIDLDRALVLKPADPQSLWLHADAAVCASKPNAALADYAALIAGESQGADPYWLRGRLRWRLADYTGATADFAQVMRLKPKFAYGVLWLELSRARGGALDPADAKNDTAGFSDDEWPGALLALYAGALKPDDIASAVERGDAQSRANRQCEADFYLAEWWLGRQGSAAAKPLLQRANEHCPHDFIEYSAARVELERLK